MVISHRKDELFCDCQQAAGRKANLCTGQLGQEQVQLKSESNNFFKA